MDYSDKPIIIIGVGHSGTRVLVEMLQRLGSDGGDYDNQWKENKFFLRLHRKMIEASSKMDWTQTLFSLEYISSFRDDGRFYDYLTKEIEENIEIAYPNYKNKPWHWKCPISLLFLETWTRIYPNAYYLHIKRNALSVTESLLKRKQFSSINDALESIRILEERGQRIKVKNYYSIQYESIESELSNLLGFLPFNPVPEDIDYALSAINRKPPLWNSKKSIRDNIWEFYVRCKMYGYRKLHK